MIRLLLLLCLGYTSFLKAADTTASPAPAPSFAMALYESEDYDRALLEFKRHLFTHPDDRRVRYLAARCQINTGRYMQARKSLARVMEDHDARLLYHYSWYAAGDYRTCFDSLPADTGDVPALLFLESMAAAGLHRWDEVRSAAAALQKTGEKTIAGHILQTADHALGIKRKIPILSAFLSLVPGLGSVYNGRYADGLFAAGFTGMLYYAGWQSHDNDNTGLAAVFGGAAVTFHAGHIFGSAATARNANIIRYRMILSALQTKAEREGWFRTFGILPE